MLVAVCMLLASIHFVEADDSWISKWQNTFDDPLCVACWPSGSRMNTIPAAITEVESRFHTWYVDRQYKVTCSNFVDTPTAFNDCFWSSQFNYEKDFKFYCGNGYLLTAFKGIHNDQYEDRKWNFHCCRVTGYCVLNCEWSAKSGFRKEFHTVAPPGKFMQAVKGDWHGGEK